MKNFEEIYKELQNQDNKELNEAWQIAKEKKEKENRITMITLMIILIIIIYYSVRFGINSVIMFFLSHLATIIFIYAAIVIIISLFSNKRKNNGSCYIDLYKEIVIRKLINNFYNNAEYFPDKEMPQYIYKNGDYERYDDYHSEDYFEGHIDNKYSIQMADIHTQEKREEKYKDANGEEHTRTVYITRFYGLFGKIELNKSINADLRILQDRSVWGNGKLEMDSSEFEKYFDVQCSDKILGMRILTADVMEELVKFENKTKMQFDIYINDDNLYLRFHSGDMFEPGDLKNGALDKDTIREYFYMLNLTYNLSRSLIKVIEETII